MAGIVPKRPTTGRKQWTLHEGPSGSLSRLRSQLASDGCPDSQLVLAKRLLEEPCEVEEEANENARLGVHWLVKASEQGHLEATDLLRQCYTTGQGITDSNCASVKHCLAMSLDEKVAKRAAREILLSLSTCHATHISTRSLRRKMREIQRRRDYHQLSSSKGGGVDSLSPAPSPSTSQRQTGAVEEAEHISEEDLVLAAVDCNSGRLPAMNPRLITHPRDLALLECTPHLQRPFIYPVQSLSRIYYRFIAICGRRFQLPTLLLITLMTLIALILIGVWVQFAPEVTNRTPILIYHIVFILMFLCTCQVLQTQLNFTDFRLWSGLLVLYTGGQFNGGLAEQRYMRNNLRPYAGFFLAFLVIIWAHSAVAEHLSQSELTLISCFATVATLTSSLYVAATKDSLSLLLLIISFALNVTLKYPYEGDGLVLQQWHFFDVTIPTYFGYVIGNGLEMCINFRAVLYFVTVPIMFVLLASRGSWHGTYRLLLPHSVTLCWLQLSIIYAQGATMYSLLRGVLVVMGVFLFLPMMGVATLILPIVSSFQWIYGYFTLDLFLTIGYFLLLSSILMALCWYCLLRGYHHLFSTLQLSSVLFTIFLLYQGNVGKISSSNDNSEQSDEIPESLLPWEAYQQLCYQPMWGGSSVGGNLAAAQLECLNLEGVPVQWDGYLTAIQVRSVRNPWRTLLRRLPLILEDWLRLSGNTDRDELRQYDRYTFQLDVRMPSSGIWERSTSLVALIAPHDFVNFTLALHVNDHVWFRGRLRNCLQTGEVEDFLLVTTSVLGDSKVYVDLHEIGCLTCTNPDLTEFRWVVSRNLQSIYSLSNILNLINVGLKSIVTTLLYPIVLFN